MILVVGLGLIGLAYDFGIQFLLVTELQKAADAAAIAGASQLSEAEDQNVVAIRVLEAVNGAAITANETRLANVPGLITIASTRLLQSVPADDDAPIGNEHVGPPYFYVEVTTGVSSTNFSFLSIFGATPIEMTATAVAGRQASTCFVTPISVCNPFESAADIGAPFNPGPYIGHQVLGHTRIAGSQLSPGEIHWLQPPDIGHGAHALADALASAGGTGSCYGGSVGVDLRPGEVASMRTALNTQFDIYENPHFGGNARRDDRFAPAENVTKGYDASGGGSCNQVPSSDPGFMALPRDTNLSPSTRLGNGNWDCQSYWSVNHPGVFSPLGCDAPGINTIMRFEVYQYEIANGLIPNNAPIGGENGNPTCSTSDPVYSNTVDPEQYRFDRRVVTIAVLNCLEHALSNNEENVRPEGFMSAFITEPTIEDAANNNEIVLEIIGSNIPGQTGYAPVEMMESVEIIR